MLSYRRCFQQDQGGDAAWSRCYRVAAACVVLLCVLLLTAITVLWIKYNILDTEYNQLQTSNNNLAIERDQLQTSFNTLTIEIDQLQTSYNTLSIERDQLQASYNTLSIEIDQLQTSYNTLSIERDQLQTSNNNLTIQRDQLQTSNNNLTIQRDQLQIHIGEIQILLKLGWTYFGSSLYFISTEKKLWTESGQDCRERGSNLVIINSRDEQEFINKLLGRRIAWIGLNDRDSEGEWKWVDDTPLSTAFWEHSEPDNDADNEDCVVTGYKSDPFWNWTDYPCDYEFIWICEKTIFN